MMARTGPKISSRARVWAGGTAGKVGGRRNGGWRRGAGGWGGADAAGERVGGGVGDRQGVVERRGVHDGEDGAEDFFAGEGVGGGDGGEDVGADEWRMADGGWRMGGGREHGEFEFAAFGLGL